MGCLQLSADAEGPYFIGTEEKEVLNDICHRCFFSDSKEKTSFWNKVTESVGSDSIDNIKSEDFEIAFSTALNLLRKRGEAVFQKAPKPRPTMETMKPFKVRRRI